MFKKLSFLFVIILVFSLKVFSDWNVSFSPDISGLEFYSDFTETQYLQNADWSLGSAAAGYTASRSSVAPETVVGTSGIMALSTTADAALFPTNYYDLTGYHAISGLQIEKASTNVVLQSDGSNYAGYTTSNSVSGTATFSNTASVADLTSIAGAYGRRLTYTSSNDANKQITSYSPSPSANSATSGNYVPSIYVKDNSVGVDCPAVNLDAYDGNNKQIAEYPGEYYTGNANTHPTYGVWCRLQGEPLNVPDYTKSISSISGNGTRVTVVTTTNHGISNGGLISISGTGNYNGDVNKTMTNVNATSFYYPSTATGNEASGTVTQYVNRIKPRFIMYGIHTGDVVDVTTYGQDVEKSDFATTFIPTTSAVLTRPATNESFLNANNSSDSETIFLKVFPRFSATSLTSTKFLYDTDGKSRRIIIDPTSKFIQAYPNQTDNSGVYASSTTQLFANTSYVVAVRFQHVSPYVSVFINGVKQGDYTSDDWTAPAYGTNFYLGRDAAGTATSYSSLIYQKIQKFSRGLSDTEIATVSARM